MQNKTIEQIIIKYPRKRYSLIPILQDIQEQKGYLPSEDLEYISRKTGVSLNTIYGVATFYSQFFLKPQGKHSICVCIGTACHVKGSDKILEFIEKKLNIKDGETTKDKVFSLQAVRCIGACSLAPAIMIDNKVYGKLNLADIENLLKAFLLKS